MMHQICEIAFSFLKNIDSVVIFQVRPFVDGDVLWRVSEAAHLHGASGAYLPLVSTVIAIDADGFLDHALDRTKYWGSQTPQAFAFDVIVTVTCGRRCCEQ